MCSCVPALVARFPISIAFDLRKFHFTTGVPNMQVLLGHSLSIERDQGEISGRNFPLPVERGRENPHKCDLPIYYPSLSLSDRPASLLDRCYGCSEVWGRLHGSGWHYFANALSMDSNMDGSEGHCGSSDRDPDPFAPSLRPTHLPPALNAHALLKVKSTIFPSCPPVNIINL